MTPDQEAARREALVSAARAVLALDVGLVSGCRRINRAASRIGEAFETSFREEFRSFGDLSSEASELPASSERLRWNIDALLERDAVLSEIEMEYRPRVLTDCSRLIAKYG